MSSAKTATSKPSVSVIICTSHRFHTVLDNLNALTRQTATNFEVILVDSHPDNPFHTALNSFKAPFKLHHLTVHQHNLPVARNTGIRHAHGNIIAFLDDDALPPPNWIARIIQSFKTHPAAAVIGGTTTTLTSSYMARFAQHYYSWGNTPETRTVDRIIGTNMAFHLPRIKKLEPLRKHVFNQHYTIAADDTEACYYLKSLGAEIIYDPHLTVAHHYRTHLVDFVNRQVQYATGDWQVSQEYPQFETLGPYQYISLARSPITILHGVYVLLRRINQVTRDLGFTWLPAIILKECSYAFGLWKASNSRS